MSYMKVELFDDGADVVAAIGAFTARRPDEVVSDSLRTYLWVLHQQTFGKRVLSVNSKPEDTYKVADLVQDKKVAQAYFEKLKLKW